MSRSAASSAARGFGAVAGVGLAVALVIAVLVGGYLGGWWLRADSVDREVGVQNRNTGTQTAWRDEAQDSVAEIATLPADSPAVGALTGQACDLISRLSPDYKTADLAAFETTECA